MHKDTDLQNWTLLYCLRILIWRLFKIWAIANYSPIMERVVDHANNGGYVMGICNGFQILCESGLLEEVFFYIIQIINLFVRMYLNPTTKNSLNNKSIF